MIFFRSKPHSSSSATRHLSSKENRRSIHETTSNRTTSTTTAAASATTTANNAQHLHNNNNNINNGNGNSNATVAKVTKSNPAKIVTSSSEPVRDLVRLRQGHCLWRVHAGMVGGRVSLRSLVFALLVLLPGHKEGTLPAQEEQHGERQGHKRRWQRRMMNGNPNGDAFKGDVGTSL